MLTYKEWYEYQMQQSLIYLAVWGAHKLALLLFGYITYITYFTLSYVSVSFIYIVTSFIY